MTLKSISFPRNTLLQGDVSKKEVVIQNIRFFDNAASCISQFENTHWTKKSISFIQSFGTLFAYLDFANFLIN